MLRFQIWVVALTVIIVAGVDAMREKTFASKELERKWHECWITAVRTRNTIIKA